MAESLTSDDRVASLGRYDWTKPCCEVMRLRDPNLFDRWCIVHHHWRNSAAPAQSVIDRELEDLRFRRRLSREEGKP